MSQFKELNILLDHSAVYKPERVYVKGQVIFSLGKTGLIIYCCVKSRNMWRQNFEFVMRVRSFVRVGVSQTTFHPFDDKASVTVIYIGIPLLFCDLHSLPSSN